MFGTQLLVLIMYLDRKIQPQIHNVFTNKGLPTKTVGIILLKCVEHGTECHSKMCNLVLFSVHVCMHA